LALGLGLNSATTNSGAWKASRVIASALASVGSPCSAR
jgi:hypothetical protein